MAIGRGQLIVAAAVAGIGLAGCIVVREKDPCANGACESIPLPDRTASDVDSTEPATTKSAPLADTGSDSGAGNASNATKDAGTEAASPKPTGAACEAKDDCSGADFCCYFPPPGGAGAQCATQNDCSMRAAFFVCETDGDCPSPRRCLAQTNTGHRACI